MISPSQRMAALSPHFFDALNGRIAALQASGADVIRLDVGSPDMPPAPFIVEALARSAAGPDNHGYQSHQGPPALRQAWAEMYRRVHGVALDPQRQIVPLLGSKEGIFHLMMATVNPGDIVLIPDPGYITYTQGTLFAGGQPYCLPLLAENGYLPDLESIPADVLARARVLWLNYPNNPTAAVAPLEFFAQAVDFAFRHNVLLCHDAAYTQISLEGDPLPSLLEVPGAGEVAVEVNTLSKSHNMAGWRVGAAVGSPAALEMLHKLKINVDSSHFLPILDAAVQAMTGDQSWLAMRNEIYSQRRDRVIAGLRAAGLEPEVPRASLYVWCPIPPGWTSAGFAKAMLEEAHVSLTPGTTFGAHGEGYVRISITTPDERIDEAMQRLSAVKLPRPAEAGR